MYRTYVRLSIEIEVKNNHNIIIFKPGSSLSHATRSSE